ncbi:MAG TPA: LCP family protein, partial [Acidimicrobiia bacterium]|nr:LCP family protein [Acidimicrobiia bacterium]
MNLKTAGIRSLVAVVVLVGFFAASSGIRVWGAWRSVERVEFDLGSVEERLPSTTSTIAPSPGAPATTVPAPPTANPETRTRIDDGFDVFLVIGSDLQQGAQTPDADAILLAFRPLDSGRHGLVSLPRDLAVTDPCTGLTTALRYVLQPCDTRVTGPEVVAIAIERLMTIDIDHFAELQFDDFVDIIDRVGGARFCVEHPVGLRADGRVFLDEGCTVLDGKNTLQWIRMRAYFEQVDGEWRAASTGAL